MRSRVRNPLLALVVLVSGGCEVYDASLVPLAPGCKGDSRQPPARPRVEDGPASGDLPELVFALKDVKLDQLEDLSYLTTGFNVDDRCSVGPTPVTECSPPGGMPVPEDGEDGIDNVFAERLYPLLQLQYVPDPSFPADTLEQYARNSEEAGLGAVLLRIRGYNGQADDPYVEVDVSQSVFGTVGDGSEAPPAVMIDGSTATLPDGDPLPAPAWQGDDWFWGRSDSFAAGNPDFPFVKDALAYVSNYRLVVALPMGAQIRFVGPGLGVTAVLTDGVAVGTIAPDKSRIDDVIVGGRWAIADLLETAAAVGVCPGDGAYKILLTALGNIADVMREPLSLEAGSAATKCDAISIGVSFQGTRAHFGGVAAGQPLPNHCL